MERLKMERLTPERCLLMVVDIQERLMAIIHNREEVARKAALLARAAGVLGIPVVTTTQYVERIGAVLPEVVDALPSADTLDKLEFNCFANAPIRERVQNLMGNRDTLIVCGVECHICVYQTVMGGLEAGYRAWVPADAVGSRVQLNHATGLDCMRQAGAVVANAELIIYELLHKAGTPAFKALLPYLK